MGSKPTYFDRLKDPRWQRKRLEVMSGFGWRCQKCGATELSGVQFHVHHRYYVSKRDPWNYPNGCYRLLCDPCHENDHNSPDEAKGWEILVDVMGASDEASSEFAHFLLDVAQDAESTRNLFYGVFKLCREHRSELVDSVRTASLLAHMQEVK
jgi:hypothetical protein